MYLLPKKINQFSETIFDSDKNFGVRAVVKTPTDIMVEGKKSSLSIHQSNHMSHNHMSHRLADFQSWNQ